MLLWEMSRQGPKEVNRRKGKLRLMGLQVAGWRQGQVLHLVAKRGERYFILYRNGVEEDLVSSG